MKSSFHPRILALPWVALLLAGLRAGAADFGISVSATPTPLITNAPYLYTINVTNISGATRTNVFVTNTLPATVTWIGATNDFGTATNNGDTLIFRVLFLTNNTVATMTIAALPLAFGTITNTVIVTGTNAASATNLLVNQVYSGNADIGVTLTGPPGSVFVNDLMTYDVIVTNRGPGLAPSVLLSNRLPDGVNFISLSPTSPAATFTNNSLLFSLGTMTNGRGFSFQIRAQPTNSGTFTNFAQVISAGLLDPNPANDTATNSFVVSGFLPSALVATLVSTQRYNPQTGLMEQRILLENLAATNVPAARVIVSGLTNWLFNAWGTNGGNPFVVYANELGAGASVELLLELFVPTRKAVTNWTMQALAVPLPSASLPAGTNVLINRIVKLSSGNVLLEFSTVTNQIYTVLYCDDPTFSTNVQVVQPPVTAPADRTQWIDFGPPGTVSRPAETSHRFFRVLRNQ